jgi:hypothetical protein
MRLRACSCGTEHLERIPRSWWMRPFASRRHYQCSRCRATMFVPKVLAQRTGGTTGPGPALAAPTLQQPAHPGA